MKKLKENCKYALLVPTSMGVRITPQSGQPVAASNMFFMQATSAENKRRKHFFIPRLARKGAHNFCRGQPYRAVYKIGFKSAQYGF